MDCTQLKGMKTMAKAIVNAGVCGRTTEIIAESEDMVNAVIQITSDCTGYSQMEGISYEIDAYAACLSKLGQNKVVEIFREFCIHAACPVPTAALKAIEVACQLALPRNVSIEISK